MNLVLGEKQDLSRTSDKSHKSVLKTIFTFILKVHDNWQMEVTLNSIQHKTVEREDAVPRAFFSPWNVPVAHLTLEKSVRP